MLRRALLGLLMFACGIAAGLVLIGRTPAAEASAQTPAAPAVVARGPVGPGATLTDFSRIAERAVPAVVNVSSRQIVRRNVPADPFFSLLGMLCYGATYAPKPAAHRGFDMPDARFIPLFK